MDSRSDNNKGVLAVKITGSDIALVVQALAMVHAEFEFAYNAIYMKRREDEKLWPYNYETDISRVERVVFSSLKNRRADVSFSLVDIESEIDGSPTFTEVCDTNRQRYQENN